MKKMLLYITLVCCTSILFLQCHTQKKIEYDIPPTASAEYKIALQERLDKGKNLYKIYCSDCHGIFSKGKDSIPNFSIQQIDNYNALFVKQDAKSHAVARKLSQEQIDYILTFLRLRKHS